MVLDGAHNGHGAAALAAALGTCFPGVRQAGATLVGAGIAVEKCFQPGGARLRAAGLRIESLARVQSMSDDGLTFVPEGTP